MLSTIRHQEVFDTTQPDNNVPVTIIGAGATGSRVFAALLELGLRRITVYDHDVVEPHNLANQLYTAQDVGAPKVEGLRAWATQKLGTEPPDTFQFIAERYDDQELPPSVMFLLVDSFVERRRILDHLTGLDTPTVFHIIETRMASTHGEVLQFCPLDLHQVERWSATLGNDDEAEASACGASISVGTTASILANMAVWQFIHYLTNPSAADARVQLYLKPFALNVGELPDAPDH